LLIGKSVQHFIQRGNICPPQLPESRKTAGIKPVTDDSSAVFTSKWREAATTPRAPNNDA
jgi:hypothetical protein